MYLFMFVSGFLFNRAYCKDDGEVIRNKIKNQLLNLIGVYIIFSFFQWLFKLAMSGLVNNRVALMDILLIFGKTISPYWYLYVLILFYLFFSLVKINKFDERLLLVFFIALSVLSVFVNINNWFEIKRFMLYALFFYLGTAYSRNEQHFLFEKYPVLILGIISLALLAVLICVDLNLYVKHIVKIVTALGFTIVIFLVFKKVELLSRVKVFLLCGKYCLEIYVIHCFFTSAVRIVMEKIGIHNLFISISINMVISIALPVLFSYICRRLNIHGLFFKPYTFVTNFFRKENTNN